MMGKTLNKIGKKFLRPYKKHKDTIAFIGFILSVLSIILALLPFIVEERIVLIQKIRVIELPIINEYTVTSQETLKITASVYAIVERANGTREILKTYP
jgi:hypothetical protein